MHYKFVCSYKSVVGQMNSETRNSIIGGVLWNHVKRYQ